MINKVSPPCGTTAWYDLHTWERKRVIHAGPAGILHILARHIIICHMIIWIKRHWILILDDLNQIHSKPNCGTEGYLKERAILFWKHNYDQLTSNISQLFSPDWLSEMFLFLFINYWNKPQIISGLLTSSGSHEKTGFEPGVFFNPGLFVSHLFPNANAAPEQMCFLSCQEWSGCLLSCQG